METDCFKVGLADTGGLLGLVDMVCSSGVIDDGRYSGTLQKKVSQYTAKNNGWSGRWPKLVTLALSRRKVGEETIIDGEYTVAMARDSGTILFQDGEIGVAPAMFRAFNDERQYVKDVLLKIIAKHQKWTWKDFEAAHALYLVAVMSALIAEKDRFEANVTLSHLLPHAKPDDCPHLARVVKLPAAFSSKVAKEEEHQSIPKANKQKRKRENHSVDLKTKHQVVLEADGTPIIDAHLNLTLSQIRDNGADLKYCDVVLFVQYKHSKLGVNAKVKG